MANRLNQQSPKLRLKDSIKREMSRINRDTLPLNCYAEVAKILKNVSHCSRSSKDNFSIDDITKHQDNKYYKNNENELETYDEYINSLTEEQNIIYYFNDSYDLDNEICYEKRFCSSLDKLPKEVSIIIKHLELSLSWCNDELEKVNNKKIPEITSKKYHSKLAKSILEYIKTINKYYAFWNKTVVDLIHLYNKYAKSHPIASILHDLVVLSSLTEEQDKRNVINKVITELYKKNIELLDSKILNVLFVCSITVKSLVIQEIGTTREFVIDKIIPNNKLKQMFFIPSD